MLEKLVVDTLEGRTDELRSVPTGRLDWSGSGALLDLYRSTSATDRTALIEAMGRIIEHHEEAPSTIAQLIHIASSLDIAQVEPQVRRLQATTIGRIAPVKAAIENFLAFRDLKPEPTKRTAPTVEANGSVRRMNGKPTAAKRVAAKRSSATHPKSAGSKSK